MGLEFLFINVMVFIVMILFMGIVCINMASDKVDNRNNGAGYRTRRSMQSKESWNLGNKIISYCTIPIALVEGIAIFVEEKILIKNQIISGESTIMINFIIFIIVIIISIIITEYKLRTRLN